MADPKYLSKVTIGEEVYDLKDAEARSAIEQLESYSDYLGVTTTALEDGASTNPITINEESVTAIKGNIVNYGAKEFIWNGSVWQEFGDMSALGDLAFEDSAEATYTPEGTIDGIALDKEEDTKVKTYSLAYTTDSESGEDTVSVGSLPSFTVSGETLTLDPGTLPTVVAKTVVTNVGTIGVHSDETTGAQATFTGTEATITVEPAEAP